jgi:hypothetical protein
MSNVTTPTTLLNTGLETGLELELEPNSRNVVCTKYTYQIRDNVKRNHTNHSSEHGTRNRPRTGTRTQPPKRRTGYTKYKYQIMMSKVTLWKTECDYKAAVQFHFTVNYTFMNHLWSASGKVCYASNLRTLHLLQDTERIAYNQHTSSK